MRGLVHPRAELRITARREQRKLPVTSVDSQDQRFREEPGDVFWRKVDDADNLHADQILLPVVRGLHARTFLPYLWAEVDLNSVRRLPSAGKVLNGRDH